MPDLLDDVADLHAPLTASPGHRASGLDGSFECLGGGNEIGGFTSSRGSTVGSIVVAQKGARTGGSVSLGLAYARRTPARGPAPTPRPQPAPPADLFPDRLGGTARPTACSGRPGDRIEGDAGRDRLVVGGTEDRDRSQVDDMLGG
jgi:hypothetical protein